MVPLKTSHLVLTEISYYSWCGSLTAVFLQHQEKKKNLNSLLKRLEIEQVKCAHKFFWKEKIDAFLQRIMYFSEIIPSPASLKVCRDFARANLLEQLIK